MKIPSSFLYDLVHKLTKSEKRYLKIQAGAGNKDYIQLMDALLKQKKFDENQLLKDNDGSKFTKHLPVNKRYLYDLILKSLANFGEKKLENKVYDKITAANILIERGLFTAAANELKKGQKVAREYELFNLQISLLSIEKKLLSTQQQKNREEQAIDQIYNLEMDCLKQLQNTNEYWYLAQQITQFQMKFQKAQTAEQEAFLNRLTQSPKFQNESLASNFKSKLYLHQATATYHFIQGNIEEAYKTNKRFLDFLESNPRFLRIYAERYLATLNNMLIDSLIIGKYDNLTEGIRRLEMTLERPQFKSIKNIESRVFRQRYLLLINWSLSQKEFEKVLEWIPDIEDGLQRFGKKIEKHHRITFYYLVAYVLFQNGQYDAAFQWNNLILNTQKQDVVKEIFYFSRVLNLLIQYELKNYTLLESLLSSTPKYLKSRRSIYATEKALFRLLGKLLNAVNHAEQETLLQGFHTEVNELAKQPSEQRVFNYLDLRIWISKK